MIVDGIIGGSEEIKEVEVVVVVCCAIKEAGPAQLVVVSALARRYGQAQFPQQFVVVGNYSLNQMGPVYFKGSYGYIWSCSPFKLLVLYNKIRKMIWCALEWNRS